MAATPRQLLKYNDYTVGLVCALDTELTALRAMLDDEHQNLPALPQDENSYHFGTIHDHNVVIACLAAEETGKVSAATVANNMRRSFENIKFGFLVGIGGGAPYAHNGARGNINNYAEGPGADRDIEGDIRLGDVAISLHSKSTEAVVQYDFGKSEHGGFIHAGGKLNKPPQLILTAVQSLKSDDPKSHGIPEMLSEAGSKSSRMKNMIQYPGSEKDQLFKSNFIHIDREKSCEACACRGPLDENLVERLVRDDSARPRLHYGTIGSADQVIEDATLRDKLSQKHKIICFEMEAAGLMNMFPCIVIRGICDYADSHKNNIWQDYAAATAAAYAKKLLCMISGQDTVDLPPIEQNVHSPAEAHQYNVYHVYHRPWGYEVETEEEEESEDPSRKRRRISFGTRDDDEDEDDDDDEGWFHETNEGPSRKRRKISFGVRDEDDGAREFFGDD